MNKLHWYGVGVSLFALNNAPAAFVRTSHRLTEINRLLFLRTTEREKSHPEKLLLSGWT
jgi:hypothetical protein